VNEGFEKFVELENRIYRIIEVYKAARAQKEAVERDFQKLKSQIEHLSGENEKLKSRLQDVEKERDLVRQKVETILATLDQLQAS
jgi:chromosome segregation ATPase